MLSRAAMLGHMPVVNYLLSVPSVDVNAPCVVRCSVSHAASSLCTVR